MSGERYSTLDESSLRKLLDGTSDLDERRLIRSAIREIRRCEIEGMEAALSSKRFRGARNCEQLENKENQIRFQRLCPDQDDTLEALSGKLQSIEDVDELTVLLRGASEYEERKLIRAAIRKLRAQELEASEQAICESRLDSESFQWHGSREADPEPAHSKADPEIDNLEERQRIRAQIRELRSQQNQEGALQRAGMTSGMVLVLDPLNKEEATVPSRQRLYSEASERELASRQRLDSGASDRDLSSRQRLDSRASEQELLSRQCLDSRASDRDLSSRQRLDSGASERDLSSRQRLDSGASESDLLSRQHLDSEASERDLSSLQRQGSEPTSSSSTDSELACESRLTGGAPEQALLGREDKKEGEGVSQTDQDKDLVDGNAFSRGGPCKKEPVSQNSLQNGGEKRAVNGELGGRSNSSRQTSVTKDPLYSRSQTSLSCAKDKAAEKAAFNRASSVRDRVKRFTAEEPGQRAELGTNFTGQRRGSSRVCGNLQSPFSKATQRGEGSNGSDRFGKNKSGLTSQSPAEKSVPLSSTLVSGPAITGSSNGVSQTRRLQGVSADRSSPLSRDSQSERARLTSSGDENLRERSDSSDQSRTLSAAEPQTQPKCPHTDPDMKTQLTIEIKDSHGANTATRVTGNTGSQRAELTLGLRATPFKIISSSNTNGALKMEMEPTLAAEATETPPSDTDVVPNCTQPAHGKGAGHRGKLTAEELDAIEDEEVLDKMIVETTDFEARKLIRAAMRELRKKKRDQREKEREKERETRLQEMKQKQEEKRSQTARAGEMVVRKTEKISHSDDGSRASRTTTTEASYMKRSENSTTVVQTKSSFSSTSSSTSTKKMGSIFDREDDSSSRALERKQAERHKEIMRSQTLPKTSATQARKAMIEKLEKGSGSPANPAVSRVVKVQKTSSFGVPNANSIKQMLLDWCRAKTRGYEHVDIQNFSSSWSDGMAFCALVHNFFPESFDYMALNPQNRRKNFEVAFTNAETLADCPQLLDVEDMVRMREPDWKCVYTYIQEFYRGLVQKGLVKTKNS